MASPNLTSAPKIQSEANSKKRNIRFSRVLAILATVFLLLTIIGFAFYGPLGLIPFVIFLVILAVLLLVLLFVALRAGTKDQEKSLFEL